MRFGSRAGVSPKWFDTHRTDVAGGALLVAVLVFIAILVKIARE